MQSHFGARSCTHEKSAWDPKGKESIFTHRLRLPSRSTRKTQVSTYISVCFSIGDLEGGYGVTSAFVLTIGHQIANAVIACSVAFHENNPFPWDSRFRCCIDRNLKGLRSSDYVFRSRYFQSPQHFLSIRGRRAAANYSTYPHNSMHYNWIPNSIWTEENDGVTLS